MKIYTSENNVTLKWDDESSEPGFVGYELSRKVMGSDDWLVWDGTGWGGAVQILTVSYFNEFDLADGGYQYRVRTDISGTFSDYEYSEWAIIGIDKLGWTFDNYIPPDGSFGDILTPDDMRYFYLWGVDFKASNGESFNDNQIRYAVESAASELERALNYCMKKRVLLCEPTDDKVQGVDYDYEEDPYRFRPDYWQGIGFLPLRWRPVISVERADLISAVDTKILDLMNWIRLDKRKGHLHFYPKAGDNGIITGSAYAMTAIGIGLQGQSYPHGLKIDYTAGLKSAKLILPDMRDVVGKIASLKLLNVIGDGLIAGFSSSSLSLDGVSESFSSTQSATSAYFGARIKVYADDVAKYIKDFRRKNGSFVMGTL